MESLYHAYQAYERQVEMGQFPSHRRKAPRNHPLVHERLLAGLGDDLIRAGYSLKKRFASSQAAGYSPIFGKLNQ